MLALSGADCGGPNAMSVGEQIAKVIGALPGLLWSALAFYVIWRLRETLAGAVARLSGFEGWGMKFSLTGGEQALQAAFEIAAKHPDWPVNPSIEERNAALDAAKRHRKSLEGAEILWVDDCPSNNRNEARMLRSFGCLITFAATTDEAMRALKLGVEQAQPFHLILSDISRRLPTQDPTAGLSMLAEMRANSIAQPLIFYVGQPKPDATIPDGAFGITHRPDQLLKLVVDAMVRVRGG